MTQKVKVVVLKHHEFENRRLYLRKTFWHFGPVRSRNSVDFLKKTYLSKKLSTETLMKKLNHKVIEKSEFQQSANQNLNYYLFWKIFINGREKFVGKIFCMNIFVP